MFWRLLAAVCRSRVEEGRGGGRLPVEMVGAFAAAPQSGWPWPRFPSPLIEPDCRFPVSGFARRKVKSIFPVSPLLLLLANKRSSSHASGTSGLPPGADSQGGDADGQ